MSERVVGLPVRRGVTFRRVLNAERGNAVSLAATWWSVLAAVVVHAAVACFVAYHARYELPAEPPTLLALLTLGLVATQLPVLGLGVLLGATDPGIDRPLLLAVPRRLPLLGARVVTAATVAALSGLLALLVTSLAVLPFRSALGLTLNLTSAESARVLSGFVLYLVAMALLGTGLGTLLRRPAGGLVAAVVLMYLAEQALLLAGAPEAQRALPGWAGRLVAAPDPGATTARAGVDLDPWHGFAVLGGWTVLVLAAAALRLRRRDV